MGQVSGHRKDAARLGCAALGIAPRPLTTVRIGRSKGRWR